MVRLKTTESGRNFIKKEEGIRLIAYNDGVNIYTIGIGHTGYVDGIKIKPGMKITKEKAEALFIEDLSKIEEVINNAVIVPLNQNQFDALVSLVFNIGGGNFRKSTLLRKLNVKDYKGSAEQFLAWKYAGGKPILLSRRLREQAVFVRK
ncbi:lysozyme [Pasteurella bettyae]|uniref:lysozyme n=1 Tax=Pasteurella bettyae TaxID=752 RepID=UPI003D2E68F4